MKAASYSTLGSRPGTARALIEADLPNIIGLNESAILIRWKRMEEQWQRDNNRSRAPVAPKGWLKLFKVVFK